jgi:hypothetical protein
MLMCFFNRFTQRRNLLRPLKHKILTIDLARPLLGKGLVQLLVLVVIVSETEACWYRFIDSCSLLTVHILMFKLGLRSPQVGHSVHFDELISGKEFFILLLLVFQYSHVCIYPNLGHLCYFTILLHGLGECDSEVTNRMLLGLI